MFRIERKKYHAHREKSKSSDKCFTIIVDGMDQSKTNLPNTKLISKSTSSLWRLRTHVTGLILHAQAPVGGKLVYSFVDLIQYPYDSNLTLTVIINALVDFVETSSLPKVLYLQMDNTCRENKNRYVLTFCAILVYLGIFNKVVKYVLCGWLALSFRLVLT